MSTVYLGLGGNQGDRLALLRAAVDALARELEVDAASSVYETEPVGLKEQPDFLNAVVRARTDLEPAAVLDLALRVERGLGRERSVANAPRTVDVDLLLYDDVVLAEPGLCVPHPRMTERGFVLVPLLELDPALRDPASGKPLRLSLDFGGFERVARFAPPEALIDREGEP